MKQSLRTLAFVLLVAIGWTGQANADSITINFTADNATLVGAICADVNCTNFNLDIILIDGTEPNASTWQNADTVVFDLASGTYGIAFAVENFGQGGAGNPAGFLAEILWQGMTNVTSSAWDVTVDGVNWVSATEWAQNGTGIWGGNLLGEISSDAFWIWDDINFNGDTQAIAGFRTSITVTAVPEPGTLMLLGIGLLGMGVARRKKV